ncbi:MAG: phosphoenolpyruvate synthase [Syntrophobacteraceae bacterium]|nr:phosphoenolpyruvate synthase [Syntrophobacteraceae bacterium]
MDSVNSTSSEGTEARPWYRKAMSRTWNGFKYFLELIGILQGQAVDQAAQVARLRLYHTEFRKLLSSNNSFLENLGDLEQKLYSSELVDRAFVKRKVVRILTDIHAMVESINVISGDRYTALRESFDRIAEPLGTLMEESTESAGSQRVLDLSEVSAAHAELAGGKMANLSEVANVLGLPTPDGMVITTEGFRELVEKGGIRSWIQDKHLEIESPHDIDRISEELRDRILDLEVPSELQEEILAGYDRLAERAGKPVPVAVRSSAVGEDSDFSFAGQFLSVLNVRREDLAGAYLRVAASLYSTEAMYYRFLHAIPGESAQMAVGCIEMVDAAASGVVFSRDPNRPDSGKVLIHAIKGLGVMLVDGRTSPEVIQVSRDPLGAEVDRSPSSQKSRIVLAGGSGVEEKDLQPGEAGQPCISDDQAVQLAGWALQLEAHFGSTQDVEWALDHEGRLIVLQSRPLALSAHSTRTEEPVTGFPLLVRGGEVGCPGIGIGPAKHMSEDDDMETFPDGAVLVARRSSPRFVRLMSRATAIVTDAGSTTGHMASLARELRVPTLLNTRSAVQSIPDGTLITVDASSGFVYEGEVPALAEKQAAAAEEGDFSERRKLTPGYRLLAKVVENIAPLHLTDPAAANFTAQGCLTLHDMARYIHEKSYKEMFMLGNNVGDLRASSYYLDVFLPIDLYIIDLGGGLEGSPKQKKVKRSQVTSVPLKAVLDGMLHKKIQRFGARPMDLGGLFSIMMRHAMTSPEEDESFRAPCYAIISDKYLNYTARVGYHFSVLDTYCGETPNKNYISMVFQGGAADFVRRSRRARAIASILKEHGFTVKVHNDIVNARLSKAPLQESVAHLQMLGSLFQFFRQMDAAMTSENAVSLYAEAFLDGDYALERFKSGN